MSNVPEGGLSDLNPLELQRFSLLSQAIVTMIAQEGEGSTRVGLMRAWDSIRDREVGLIVMGIGATNAVIPVAVMVTQDDLATYLPDPSFAAQIKGEAAEAVVKKAVEMEAERKAAAEKNPPPHQHMTFVEPGLLRYNEGEV